MFEFVFTNLYTLRIPIVCVQNAYLLQDIGFNRNACYKAQLLAVFKRKAV